MATWTGWCTTMTAGDAAVQPDIAYRQQVLILHLQTRSLKSATVAWALYDGSATEDELATAQTQEKEAPYDSVVSALREGWELLQAPCLSQPRPPCDWSGLARGRGR